MCTTIISLHRLLILLSLCLVLWSLVVTAQWDDRIQNRRARKPPRLSTFSFRLRADDGARRYNAAVKIDPYYRLPTLPPSPDVKEWRIDESVFLSSANIQRGDNSLLGRRLQTVTGKLVAANICVFLLQVISPSITRWGAKLSGPILRGEQLYRLITPIFLHGGLTHLAINTASLLNIGPQVESIMGKNRFLATYLASGAFGNYVSSLFSPNPSVGASGAIFGLVGAYYTFLKTNQVGIFQPICVSIAPLHLTNEIFFFIAKCVVNHVFQPLFGTAGESGMRALQQTFITNLAYGLLSPAIDNWGHFGGAIGGAAAAYAIGPRLYVSQSMYNGRKILVDKPLVRVPKYVESLPQRIGVQLQRFKRKLQIDKVTLHLSQRSKSWLRNHRRK
jgi:membrane associated rhomboid family serine protease